MLKVLGEWLQPKRPETPTKRPAIVRREIESLFHEDFLAHAMIAKPRKAARAASQTKTSS
jgi:hypothetical protein